MSRAPTALATLLLCITMRSACGAVPDEPQTFLGKTVEQYASDLRNPKSDRALRYLAVRALGGFGPKAKVVVPELVEESRRGEFKNEAIDALIRIGGAPDVTVPALIGRFVKQGCEHLTGMGTFIFDGSPRDSLVKIGAPAVPALLKILEGPDASMRVCAADALGRIGPQAKAAVPALIRVIETPPFHVQYVRALGQIGPEAMLAVPALNRLLGSKEVEEFDVVMALGNLGAPPIRYLTDKFHRDGDLDTAFELACLGAKAHEAVPALRGTLGDERLEARASAAFALAHIDPSAANAIPMLIEALEHVDDLALDDRLIAQALAKFGPRAKDALPALIKRTRREEFDEFVLKALVLIDPEGKECVPALTAALRHSDYRIVDIACDCLGLLGPKAAAAVPALLATVTRDFKGSFANGYDPQVAAANALRRVGRGDRSVIPGLIAALKYRHMMPPDLIEEGFHDRDSLAAAAAAQVLGSFGRDAKSAVPALIEAIPKHEQDGANDSVRQAAILALGQIGPDAVAAVPVLRGMLKENGKDSPFAPELLVALYQLDPDGQQLAERWLANPANAQGRNVEGRALVLSAMGRPSLEADAQIRGALERVDSMLRNPDPRDGDAVDSLEDWIQSIGRFGKGSRRAILRLKELRNHPSPFVRLWAEEALESVEPGDGK